MLKLVPLLKKLTIQDKQTKALIRLDLSGSSEFAWAQRRFAHEVERQYNNGDPVRIITLKARQLGISTVTEGILFNWAFIHPGTNGLVVAHESESSEELFKKTKLFWDTWPFKQLYTPKYQTRRQLHWLETLSDLKVATAKNLQAGRGTTFHAVHLSECAFYPDPETLMTGLNQTIPDVHGSIIVLESTANGKGNWWHEQWQAAEEGDSDYVPLFFPWFKHYEYQRPTTLSIPSELTADERTMLDEGASYENIEWYRWVLYNKLSGDEQRRAQEYPTTPEDAFVSTGHRIFPHVPLKACYEKRRGQRGMLYEDQKTGKVLFEPDATGPFTLFKRPIIDGRSDRYFCAGDPSMAIEGDPCCMQVINRATHEQVAVWHGQLDPITFGKEMMLVGRFFGDCMLCPEVEGGGQGTVAVLLDHNYPNVWLHRWSDKAPGKLGQSYGWSTNYNRKYWAVGVLKNLIIDGSLLIHDPKTFNQLDDYVVRNDGTMGNSGSDGHDDAVMAMAICVTASHTEGPFSEYTREAPILEIYRQEFQDQYGT